MKIQFKEQQFQLDAVNAVADIFLGQPNRQGIHYMADPGRDTEGLNLVHDAYRNAPIELSDEQILKQMQKIQVRHHIQPSKTLFKENFDTHTSYNFTVEMETGTGKTYTYIRTIMELNKRYGWLKFIIVVPSVAIREGVLKSFQMMDDHFQLEYGKKPRYFVYDSSRLGELDTFANSSDIRVMIINSQAFNANGKDARRINMEQESFNWRKPIDVIASMNPILIIDEPQSVEGKATKERLKDFAPLFTLRYSATHKETYNMVYRLDAMDAYNRKLVKKIAVKAIEQLGTTGTEGYLYLQEIVPQKTGAPKARIEFEQKTKTGGIKRRTRLVEELFDLYSESNNLEVYRGWTLSHYNARENTIQIGATQTLSVGQVIGEADEEALRRHQIRETIKSHLTKEIELYGMGIKVLSLFFIDEVAKYKQYDAQHNPFNGEYADIFETEYGMALNELLAEHPKGEYADYLRQHSDASQVHAGYFSVDKVKKSDKTIFVDFKSATEKKKNESVDKDAYDLIMKDKERLLSFEEPVRFIFSHSALKEGWDNPNVFQICTLKQSGAEIRKRQEIGRGMRLAVNQDGVRQDIDTLGDDVHNINRLTIIANESYEKFARSLQEELKEVLKDRPQTINEEWLRDKVLVNESGNELKITPEIARDLYFDLIANHYIDRTGGLLPAFDEAIQLGTVQLPDSIQGYESAVGHLLESVYSPSRYQIENENETSIILGKEVNEENIARQEFLSLWKTINHKSTFQVDFDDEELINRVVKELNQNLVVNQIEFEVTEAEAREMEEVGYIFDKNRNGTKRYAVKATPIQVKYDLLGEVAEQTQLTRQTVADILSQMQEEKFNYFKTNPEEFIRKTSRIINDQKSSQIVEKISYNILEDSYDTTLFYDNKDSGKIADSNRILKSHKSVYNYTKVDSITEKKLQAALEEHDDVQVYVKLPNGFKISTPMGNYNPDWAIAFREGSVKHIYFVAETKGDMSSLQLKGVERDKIECARRHFRALKEAGYIPDDQIYGVISNYEELISIVRGG